MSKAGIYLMVDFEWASPFEPAHGKMARHLHDVVQGRDWIKEVMAASGGIGAGSKYVWVFWLENYAASMTRSSSGRSKKAATPSE